MGISIFAFVLTTGIKFGCPPADEVHEYSQLRMGTRVVVRLAGISESDAELAAKAVFDEFDRIEWIASDYRPKSEVNRLCQSAVGRFVKISPDLFQMLSFAQKISRLSDGAFDVTCGNLTQLWRRTRDTLRLPTKLELASAIARTGYKMLTLDAKLHAAKLAKRGMKIDLGGIAKGFACQKSLELLKRNHIRRALIWAGGDIVAGDPPQGERGWKIQISGIQSSPIYLANRAISTSGDLEQNLTIDGVRYSHIVDVKTGLGIRSRVQASVLSSSGLISDPLAKICCLLPPERAHSIARLFGAEVIRITRRD